MTAQITLVPDVEADHFEGGAHVQTWPATDGTGNVYITATTGRSTASVLLSADGARELAEALLAATRPTIMVAKTIDEVAADLDDDRFGPQDADVADDDTALGAYDEGVEPGPPGTTPHNIYRDGVEPVIGRRAATFTYEGNVVTGTVEANPYNRYAYPRLRIDGTRRWIRLDNIVHLLP